MSATVELALVATRLSSQFQSLDQHFSIETRGSPVVGSSAIFPTLTTP
jgi:hypothetical protein